MTITTEATLITTLAAIPLLWLYFRLLRRANLLVTEPPEEESTSEELPEPIIVLPRRAPRRAKRRPM
ncbi:MAG: hypothetical protein HY741_30255 [Chloroflexi bacterium]|nr:hypothetical protein [Chloroflexota bacterium]